MSTTRVFQAAVVVNWLLYAITYFTPTDFFARDDYLREVLNGDGFDAVPWAGTAAVVLFWAYLVAAVGLFFFQRWARTLFLALTVAIMAGVLFAWGTRITHPTINLMNYVVSVLDGVILAMAYLTSVAPHFRAQPPDEGGEDGPGVILR